MHRSRTVQLDHFAWKTAVKGVSVYAVTEPESLDALVDFCAEFARLIPLPPDDEEDFQREMISGLCRALRLPARWRGQEAASRKPDANPLSGAGRPTETVDSSARQTSLIHQRTFPITVFAYVPKGSEDESAWQVPRQEGEAFAQRISATFEVFKNSHDIWEWDAEGLAGRILLNRARGYGKDIDLVSGR